MTETLRFLRRVSIDGLYGCWRWTGATNNYGYGIYYVNRRTRLAHRRAHELFIGPVTAACVLHRCDTPLCCNPAHLLQDSYTENNRDRSRKGRAVRNAAGRYVAFDGAVRRKKRMTETD